MHLGGGTVNFGTLAMASSTAAATLDITGGQVSVNSDITKTGSGAGTIQVANATLIVKGRIATQASPMDVLSLDNERYASMTAEQRSALEWNLLGKLQQYRAINEQVDAWTALNEGDPESEKVYPLHLDYMP